MTAERIQHRTMLRVIEGGREAWRAEEAQAEVIAFFDEVATAASQIVDLECAKLVPSIRVMHIAGRMGHRAAAAKAEYLALMAPDGAA